jgi:hypothetical protein
MITAELMRILTIVKTISWPLFPARAATNPCMSMLFDYRRTQRTALGLSSPAHTERVSIGIGARRGPAGVPAVVVSVPVMTNLIEPKEEQRKEAARLCTSLSSEA